MARHWAPTLVDILELPSCCTSSISSRFGLRAGQLHVVARHGCRLHLFESGGFFFRMHILDSKGAVAIFTLGPAAYVSV